MTGRGELCEARLRVVESVFRLVESLLFQQRSAEDDLRAADLVEEVLAAAEQPQRVSRLLFGEPKLAGAQMHLRERRDRLRRVRFAARLERNRERLLQMGDCIVRLPEQVVEAAQVVEHATEVDAVAVLLV